MGLEVGLSVGELVGAVEGAVLGDADGDSVGDAVGLEVGLSVGELVGAVEGAVLGDADGDSVGDAVGLIVGAVEGAAEGLAVGDSVGDHEGDVDGDRLGLLLGLAVGDSDGASDGDTVGLTLGKLDGATVGLALGDSVVIVVVIVVVAVVTSQPANSPLALNPTNAWFSTATVVSHFTSSFKNELAIHSTLPSDPLENRPALMYALTTLFRPIADPSQLPSPLLSNTTNTSEPSSMHFIEPLPTSDPHAASMLFSTRTSSSQSSDPISTVVDVLTQRRLPLNAVVVADVVSVVVGVVITQMALGPDAT